MEEPVHCRVTRQELVYGKVRQSITRVSTILSDFVQSNCSWASCREGCTMEIFKCHQIRVTYTPQRAFQNDTFVSDIAEAEWANLARAERTTVSGKNNFSEYSLLR